MAAMPISLRPSGNADYTTQATMSLVNLNTQIADPVKRLHAIRDASQAVKTLARQADGVIPTDFPSIGVPWLLHGLASLYGRSGIADAVPPIANVAGARMTTYWPLSIVEHGVALNITVMSYCGEMGFGFTAARCAVPDARELSAALMLALSEFAPRRSARRATLQAARA
jgi:hypothetical protein